jgi:two-component system NarL family response regulator
MKDPRFVSVLIADDHPIVCVGLTSLINRERGLRVVAEANSWPQAIAGAVHHRPGLAILDLHMPGMEAADAIPVIREKSPETRIVVLSAFGGDEDVFKVLRAGAIGYLPKDAERESIRECISAVREDKTWVHPSSAAKLAGRIQAKDITSRESEVLRLVASGKSNKEIGAFLGVTEGTVKVHVNHLFAKLGVDGRVAATMLALQRGFVHLPLVPDSSANRLVSREKRRAS